MEEFNLDEPKTYYEQMIISAKNHEDCLFHNNCITVKRPDIYSIILDNAEKEVNLVIDYEMTISSEEITNNQKFINSIKNFLDKPDTILKIIITHAPENRVIDNNFYESLFNHSAYTNGRIILKFIEGDKCFKRTDDKSKDEVEFCVGDERMFNICVVNKQYDMTNFNKPDWAKGMVEKFKKVLIL